MQHLDLTSMLKNRTRVYTSINNYNGPISALTFIISGSNSVDEHVSRGVYVTNIDRGTAEVKFTEIVLTKVGVKSKTLEEKRCRITDLAKWLHMEKNITFVGEFNLQTMAILTELLLVVIDSDYDRTNIKRATFMETGFIDFGKLHSSVWRGYKIPDQVSDWDKTLYTMQAVEGFMGNLYLEKLDESSTGD